MCKLNMILACMESGIGCSGCWQISLSQLCHFSSFTCNLKVIRWFRLV